MAYYIEFIRGFLSYIGFIGNIGALHPLLLQVASCSQTQLQEGQRQELVQDDDLQPWCWDRVGGGA